MVLARAKQALIQSALDMVFRSRNTATRTAYQRELAVFRNMSSTAVSKLLYAASSLLIVPFALKYLGVEGFGLWSILSSLVAIISFLDFGLGYGLLNMVVRAFGENRREDIQRLVATVLLLLAGIGLIAAILFYGVQLLVPVKAVFGLKTDEAVVELQTALPVLLLIIVLSVPATAIRQAQVGVQRGHVANWWEATGYLLGFFSTLLVIELDGGIVGMLAAYFGIPLLFRYLNGMQILWMAGMRFSTVFAKYDRQIVPSVLRAGLLFFTLQLAGVIGFQSDNFVIGALLGAAAVSEYAVAMKIFSIPSTITGFLLMAIWPAYGDAFARGENAWIRRTFRRTLIIIFVVNVPITIALALSAQWIAVNWIDPTVRPSGVLVAAMATWSMLTILTGAFAALLNGLHVVRFQVATAVAMAVLNIVLSIIFVKFYGVVGAIYGSIVSVLVCTVAPTWFYTRRYFATQLTRPSVGLPIDS